MSTAPQVSVATGLTTLAWGGLSFYYTDYGNSTDNSTRKQNLSVIPDGRPAIIHIPCRTVCDSETGELIFPNQRIKRRSVKFGRMSDHQKKQMRILIKEFANKS